MAVALNTQDLFEHVNAKLTAATNPSSSKQGGAYELSWIAKNTGPGYYVTVDATGNRQYDAAASPISLTVPTNAEIGTTIGLTVRLYTDKGIEIAKATAYETVQAGPSIVGHISPAIGVPGSTYTISWVAYTDILDSYVTIEGETGDVHHLVGIHTSSGSANFTIPTTLSGNDKIYHRLHLKDPSGVELAVSDVLIETVAPIITATTNAPITYPGGKYIISWNSNVPTNSYVTVDGDPTHYPYIGSSTEYSIPTTALKGSKITRTITLWSNSSNVPLASTAIVEDIQGAPRIITAAASPVSQYPGGSYVITWTTEYAPKGATIRILSKKYDDANNRGVSDAIVIPGDDNLSGTTITNLVELLDSDGTTVLDTAEVKLLVLKYNPTLDASISGASSSPGATYKVNWAAYHTTTGSYVTLTGVPNNQPIIGQYPMSIPANATLGSTITIVVELHDVAGTVVATKTLRLLVEPPFMLLVSAVELPTAPNTSVPSGYDTSRRRNPGNHSTVYVCTTKNIDWNNEDWYFKFTDGNMVSSTKVVLRWPSPYIRYAYGSSMPLYRYNVEIILPLANGINYAPSVSLYNHKDEFIGSTTGSYPYLLSWYTSSAATWRIVNSRIYDGLIERIPTGESVIISWSVYIPTNSTLTCKPRSGSVSIGTDWDGNSYSGGASGTLTLIVPPGPSYRMAMSAYVTDSCNKVKNINVFPESVIWFMVDNTPDVRYL
jgi:hypothetical protein